MKTVSLDDKAYMLLKGAKLHPGESFSELVKRTFGLKGSFRDSAGAWSDMTDQEVERLRRETIDAFGTTRRPRK